MANANAFVHSFVTDIDGAHTFAFDQYMPCKHVNQKFVIKNLTKIKAGKF